MISRNEGKAEKRRQLFFEGDWRPAGEDIYIGKFPQTYLPEAFRFFHERID